MENQDQFYPDEHQQKLMATLRLDLWMTRKLIDVGFEFRYIDPDIHRGDVGLIFGHRKCHKAVFGWVDKQLEIPLTSEPVCVTATVEEPVESPVVKEKKPGVPPVLIRGGASKGQLAYEGRAFGRSWVYLSRELGIPKAQQNAKAYAVKQGLVWPPAP